MTDTATIEQLVIEKHRAVAMAREWQAIAAALALSTGTTNDKGITQARVPKALLNQLDHTIAIKQVKGGGVVLTLTPTNGKET